MKKMTNRSRILKFIFRNAPVSRSTIAEKTGITPATVSFTVATLKSAGIVSETGGKEESDEWSAGRKRIAIDICPAHSFAAGVEFTEKAVVLCIVNLRGEAVAQRVLREGDINTADVTGTIITQLRSLFEEHMDIRDRICGIGIAAPGKIDLNSGRLVTNSSTWSSFDLRQITDRFGKNVVCENNARAMAYGRYLFDPGGFPESFAYFHVGLGMHCASIINGVLFAGNNFLAGEIGHTIVNPDGKRCECGKYGCLQTYSSERWLVKTSRLLYESGADPLLEKLVDTPEKIDIDVLTRAYSLGDAIIGGYISQAVRYLGVSISNIAIVLNPEKIFLHGQMFNNPDVCTELKDNIQRQLLFVRNGQVNSVEILPCLPEDGAIGAAALAIKRFFIGED